MENIHPTVFKIKDLLEENNMWYDYMEHEPVRTSEEAAAIRPDKYSLAQGAKALIVRIKPRGSSKRFVMLVIPGDTQFNIPKVCEFFNSKDVRFAFEDEVIKITDGVIPGGVPPFGNLFDLEVYADTKIFDNDTIVFNAGDKRISLAIHTENYRTLVNPTIIAIT
jgi:Ala-tRNA(Pro) deacylase